MALVLAGEDLAPVVDALMEDSYRSEPNAVPNHHCITSVGGVGTNPATIKSLKQSSGCFSELVSDSSSKMRFAIICLMSLFLVPALASEQHRRLSLSPSPPPPYQGSPPPYREHPPPYLKRPPPPPKQRPPPQPGNIVYYQGSDGPRTGIALASQPDSQGHYPLAPLAHPDPWGVAVHTDRIVKAHKGDVVTSKNKSMPEVASRLSRGHAEAAPYVSYASGPIRKSPNYEAEHGGNRWDRWKGGR